MSTSETLQQENRRLKEELKQLKKEHETLGSQYEASVKKVEALSEELIWFRRRYFGRSSEQLSEAEQRQLRLFDEAEESLEVEDTDASYEAISVSSHLRRRPRREKLPESFPVKEIVVDLSEEQKHCGCGHELTRIGEERSEKLDVIPPTFRVLRYLRPKYACKHCEGSGDEDHPAVRTAAMPPAVIAKGIATEGLLSFIITGKFCDALPLYRQEKQFARLGVELPRQTMADWMIAVASACEPLYQQLAAYSRSGSVLQIDETTLQVMREAERKNSSLSYMWVIRGGDPEKPGVLYHYAASRSGAVAQELVGDFDGYLQSDGYEAYDRLCEQRSLTHVGCWAHARRLFVDAKSVGKNASSATQALSYIAKLYAAEHRRPSAAATEVFADQRRAEVHPALDQLHGWLEKKALQVPESTALGKAVNYTLGQWPKLLRYLDHPQLTPDTNAVERAIRPFVVGRKNWLFSGSPRGAHASAVLYSLVETARANQQEPYWYFRRMLQHLPYARTPEDYRKLLPQFLDQTGAGPPNSG